MKESAFNVTVTIEAPAIAAAIIALAETIALGFDRMKGTALIDTHIANEQQLQTAVGAGLHVVRPEPLPAPQAVPQAVPQAAPAPVTAPAVPTAAPVAYSLDQLAVAATQLVDIGKRADLVALLGQFGVQALTALPKEQYGNFATQLRTMGARI